MRANRLWLIYEIACVKVLDAQYSWLLLRSGCDMMSDSRELRVLYFSGLHPVGPLLTKGLIL